MGRAPCCDKANVKRGPWSPEEDAALKSYIEQNGTGGNWIALPRKAGLMRCGKSCRLRWLNYLRPDIKHGGFTQQEDAIIFTLFHRLGSRWSVIASHLPGRTDNDVKNYWNTKLKKRLMAANNSNPSGIHTNPSPAPPLTLPTPPQPQAVKAESLDFSTPPLLRYPNHITLPAHASFPPPAAMGSSFAAVSPSEEEASSSGSSACSYVDWSGNSDDHLFLSALGFGDGVSGGGDYGSYQEIINDRDLGELASAYCWSNDGGVHQLGLTYS